MLINLEPWPTSGELFDWLFISNIPQSITLHLPDDHDSRRPIGLRLLKCQWQTVVNTTIKRHILCHTCAVQAHVCSDVGVVFFSFLLNLYLGNCASVLPTLSAVIVD